MFRRQKKMKRAVNSLFFVQFQIFLFAEKFSATNLVNAHKIFAFHAFRHHSWCFEKFYVGISNPFHVSRSYFSIADEVSSFIKNLVRDWLGEFLFLGLGKAQLEGMRLVPLTLKCFDKTRIDFLRALTAQ